MGREAGFQSGARFVGEAVPGESFGGLVEVN